MGMAAELLGAINRNQIQLIIIQFELKCIFNSREWKTGAMHMECVLLGGNANALWAISDLNFIRNEIC